MADKREYSGLTTLILTGTCIEDEQQFVKIVPIGKIAQVSVETKDVNIVCPVELFDSFKDRIGISLYDYAGHRGWKVVEC